MRKHWVFTIGHFNEAPPPEWWNSWDHHRTEMWFPRTKRPVAVSAGDRALIHGSMGRGFLAAVEVISHEPEPQPRPDREERFPWILRHRLLVAKIADTNVATAEDAGFPTRRIARGPHTFIEPDEYDRALAALIAAAGRSAAG